MRVVTRTRRGARLLRHVAGVDDAQDEPRADGADVDLLDEALQFDDADVVEHRRLDARGAQAHREEAGEKRRQGDPDAERDGPRAREQGERGEDGGQQRRQPQHGLAIGRQIERDAAHRRDGNPQEEPPLVDFLRQRPGEQRAPVRRQRRCAGAAGDGENAGARGGRHGRPCKHIPMMGESGPFGARSQGKPAPAGALAGAIYAIRMGWRSFAEMRPRLDAAPRPEGPASSPSQS